VTARATREETRSARRLGSLRARLSEEGLEALVVSHPPNLRYLTGFAGSSGLLLVERERALLLVDSRYDEQARDEAAGEVEVRLADDGLREGLAGELPGAGVGAVGFEAHRTTVRGARRLREEADGVSWRETDGLVEEIRARKDDHEVGLLRDAAGVACRALEQVLALVEVGATEAEVAAELDYRLRLGGTGPPAFDSIVASGPRSALPHARPSDRAIREGDLVLFDFGATVEGYCSDVTRTVVVGAPRRWQRRVHGAVRAALEAAVSAVEPGRPAAEVDAAARTALEERSVEEGAFGHSVGHGIGLEVHEKPSLSRESDDILQAGNVVTIEPGVYLRGRGGVRLEDDVVVGDGRDVISDASRDLVEI
jgi:Xaa-Pro aminopeptidase